MARFGWARSSIAVIIVLCVAAQEKRDPAAWGSNHAGKPVPEFTHGDECLFCHRNDIGPGWQKNAHGLANRQREDAPDLIALLKAEPKTAAFEPETTHTVGSPNYVRYLRKAGVRADISSFRRYVQEFPFEKAALGRPRDYLDLRTVPLARRAIEIDRDAVPQ